MKIKDINQLREGFYRKKEHYPWAGQIELTYRCDLNCVHCYCKGSENKKKELNTLQWKKIITKIKKAGCLYLTFSGGDPLIREDFLELYAYAKKNAFLVTVFTNGQSFSREIIEDFSKRPPYCVEITLNAATSNTYEKITQIKGSFKKTIETIKALKERNIPLIIKANCLKQNKEEIGKIKSYADNLLGKSKGKFYFKFDPIIFPRLNGDRLPCSQRLSFEEVSQVRKQDPDIWGQYQEGLHRANSFDLERNKEFLYQCNSWMQQFFINPYGKAKFCGFSDKYSVDLKKYSFEQAFYTVFPRLLGARFKTESKCKDCRLRAFCYNCPARAYLETGNEESPVAYYCRLAEESEKEIRSKQKGNKKAAGLYAN